MILTSRAEPMLYAEGRRLAHQFNRIGMLEIRGANFGVRRMPVTCVGDAEEWSEDH